MFGTQRLAQPTSCWASRVKCVAPHAVGTKRLCRSTAHFLGIERKPLHGVCTIFTNSTRVRALLLDFEPKCGVVAVAGELWTRSCYALDRHGRGRLVSAVSVSFFTVAAGAGMYLGNDVSGDELGKVKNQKIAAVHRTCPISQSRPACPVSAPLLSYPHLSQSTKKQHHMNSK